MSRSSDETIMCADGAVEALLEQASPRPAPPALDEQLIRDAVRAEWKSVTSRRLTRRRITNFAIAATVLLAVYASFNVFRVAEIAPLQVAAIGRSHGSIYLQVGQSERQEMVDLAAIYAGQTIITGNGAGIGLEWGSGGSLRIDQNTRIEFVSADSVYLVSGRIYFDSQPSALTAGILDNGNSGEAVLEIATDYGTITHLGTQYMTSADSDELTITVRDGRVAIAGIYHDGTAVKGQRITVSGSGRPSVTNTSGYETEWRWIEATSPIVDVNGRTTYEFLQWVAHETGLEIVFVSPLAEEIARDGILRGTVDTDPRTALRIRMLGEDLDWRIDRGTIYVSAIN